MSRLWLCFDIASTGLSLVSTVGIWALVLISYFDGASGVWLTFGIPAVSVLNITFYIAAMTHFIQKHLSLGCKRAYWVVLIPFIWCLPVLMYFGFSGTFSRLYEGLGFHFTLATVPRTEWESRTVSHEWLLWESAPQMLSLFIILSAHLVPSEMATPYLIDKLQMAVIFVLICTLSLKVFLECYAVERLHSLYLFIAHVWAVVLVACTFAWVAAYMNRRVESWVWFWLVIFGGVQSILALCLALIVTFLLHSPVAIRFMRVSRCFLTILCAVLVFLTPIWLIFVNFLRLRFVAWGMSGQGQLMVMRTESLLRFFKSGLRFCDWFMIACPVSIFPASVSLKIQVFNRVMANLCLLREHNSRQIFESAGKAVILQRLARALVLQSYQLKTKDLSLAQAQDVLLNDITLGLDICPRLTREAIQLQQGREQRRWGPVDFKLPENVLEAKEDPEISLKTTLCDLQRFLGLEMEDDAKETAMVELLASQPWKGDEASKGDNQFMRKLHEYRSIEMLLSSFVTRLELEQQINDQARLLR